MPPEPTILLVDDDEGLTLLLQKALRQEGCQIACVSSKAEASEWLGKHSADLVLIDLKLRDGGAAELMDELARAGRPPPFIVITGQGDERMAVEMMKRGAIDYLVKDLGFLGFIPALVRGTLNRLADQKRLVEVQAEREALARLIECSHDFVALADLEGRVTFMNGRARRMIGLEEHRSRGGQRFADHVAPRWRSFFEDTVLPTARIRGLWEGEMQWTHLGTGEPIDVLCSIFVVRDASGRPVGYGNVTRDVTERKRLEKEVIEIGEREQRRFGRDLHDGLGQRLTALEFFTHALQAEIQRQAPGLTASFQQLGQELRETIRLTRAVAHGLAPVTLENDGLAHALENLAKDTSALAGIDCRFVAESQPLVPDAEEATHLYRIAQEAVNNALKHGRAKTVRLSLADPGRSLVLKVEDDGHGFVVPPNNGTTPVGMGLRAMRYRAELIGAVLEIVSAPGQGCRVTCTLPKLP